MKRDNRHGTLHKDGVGGYFRMFNIDGTRFRTSVLVDLAKAAAKLTDEDTQGPADHQVPAGLTYLGQFIAHDITFMKSTEEAPREGPVSASSLVQERSPSFDLDSLYGEGFEAGLGVSLDAGGKFLGPQEDGRLWDLPRGIHHWPTDRLEEFSDKLFEARIPDCRNDENFIVAQLHVLFMNAHNRLAHLWAEPFRGMGDYKEEGSVGLQAFEHARRELTWLYQLVVVNDFLKTFLDKEVFDYLFCDVGEWGKPRPRLLNYSICESANIPVEFSGAAFRFGHSLVRSAYVLGQGPQKGLAFFFRLTGKGRIRHRVRDQKCQKYLSSKAFLREHAIDWASFFDLGEGRHFNSANYISPMLATEMLKLLNEPAGNDNLFQRNLLRGRELNLPSAQDIIAHLNERHADYIRAFTDYPLQAIRPEALAEHPLGPVLRRHGMDVKTPLWLYVLLEPHFNGSRDDKSTRLGQLGSIIIGETIRMLMDKSNVSVFKPDPGFNPAAFRTFLASPGKWRDARDFNARFTARDLISLVWQGHKCQKPPQVGERTMSRKSSLEEIQYFVKYQEPDGEPDRPAKIGAVVTHTPEKLNRIPDKNIIRYSPRPKEDYKVELYAHKKADDHWVGRLRLHGLWNKDFKSVVETMELEYEPETHSLVATDIVVIEDVLTIDVWKLHRVVGREPGKTALRDVLTWRFLDPGHDLYDTQYVTCYVWC